jgi:hypothetical protein
MFYDDCVKMCEDFAPNFGDRNWLLRHDNTPSHASFLTWEFFTKKQHDCHAPPSTYFCLFRQLKMKLKGCHFDTFEVIEADLQAVLNTLTEHDFQDAFKNGRSAVNDVYARKGATLKTMVASRPKVSFSPDGSISPGNSNKSL